MKKISKTREQKKKEYLSPQQLGPLMGVSRQTIRNWIGNGDIDAFQIGRNWKIPSHEVLRMLRHYGLPIPDWLK